MKSITGPNDPINEPLSSSSDNAAFESQHMETHTHLNELLQSVISEQYFIELFIVARVSDLLRVAESQLGN